MSGYSIEARSFSIALAWCHNFWVLRNEASGASIAELHGLAYDRVSGRILPIGVTKDHSLRMFVFPHDAVYAAALGRPVQSTRMFVKSRGQVVYRGADAFDRWNAAIRAMPRLDALDLTYPPFGFNLRTPTVNSNSAYRTFGEIMGVPVHVFPRAIGPGRGNRLIAESELRAIAFDRA